MHVEDCCQALLYNILPEIDPNHFGLTIDIGVGNFAFYCELFEQLGFKSIAVEPLPNEHLRQLCYSRNITLIESCISEIDGIVNIYIGNYEGQENLNLNSLSPDWWGSTNQSKKVNSLSLKTLLNPINSQEITCMKIDVEGMEYSIIKQLDSCQDFQLPKVLMFEYGGGGIKETNQGAWTKDILDKTMKSLEILQSLGYEQTILIDSSDGLKERITNLNSASLEAETFFDAKSVYGNIITMRGFSYPEHKIESICEPYRSNHLTPPSLKVKESFSKLVLIKMRQLGLKLSNIIKK